MLPALKNHLEDVQRILKTGINYLSDSFQKYLLTKGSTNISLDPTGTKQNVKRTLICIFMIGFLFFSYLRYMFVWR